MKSRIKKKMENQLKDCLTIQVSKEDVESPDFDLSNHIVKKFKKEWLKKLQEFQLTQHHFPLSNI